MNPFDAPPNYESTISNRNPNSTSSLPAAIPTPQLTTEEREAQEELEMARSGERRGSEGEIPEEQWNEMVAAESKLPPGWIRALDSKTNKFFYVDTKANPPRSIWVHPFDDDTFLQSIPDSTPTQSLPPRNSPSGPSTSAPIASTSNAKPTLGRRIKDKLTGQTHEQRVKERAEIARIEKIQYAAYLERRNRAIQAQQNGVYQNQYAAPQGQYGYGGGYGGGYGNSYGMGGGYGGRNRYGGGGYGGNSGMMLGGGLLGGLLLGEMLF